MGSHSLPPFTPLADVGRPEGVPGWRAVRDYDAGRYGCQRYRIRGVRFVHNDEIEMVRAKMRELKQLRESKELAWHIKMAAQLAGTSGGRKPSKRRTKIMVQAIQFESKPPTAETGVAWKNRASELARHYMSRAARFDVWGGYGPKGTVTRPAVSRRLLDSLTKNDLRRHFDGSGPIIGLHPMSPGPHSYAKPVHVDIDLHDGDEADPNANFLAAVCLYNRLIDLGLNPLLTDSNGKGGFHLSIYFSDQLALCKSLFICPLAGTGLEKARSRKRTGVLPQTNKIIRAASRGRCPKKRCLERCLWRVDSSSGRHHRREHFSRVWCSGEWIEGNEAIDFILSITGDSSAMLPAESLTFIPEREKPKVFTGQTAGRRTEDEAARLTDALKRVPGYDDYNRGLKSEWHCRTGIVRRGWNSGSIGPHKAQNTIVPNVRRSGKPFRLAAARQSTLFIGSRWTTDGHGRKKQSGRPTHSTDRRTTGRR